MSRAVVAAWWIRREQTAFDGSRVEPDNFILAALAKARKDGDPSVSTRRLYWNWSTGHIQAGDEARQLSYLACTLAYETAGCSIIQAVENLLPGVPATRRLDKCRLVAEREIVPCPDWVRRLVARRFDKLALGAL